MDLTTEDELRQPWDFSKSYMMKEKARKKLRQQKPDLLVGSPMCTLHSAWQRFNKDRDIEAWRRQTLDHDGVYWAEQAFTKRGRPRSSLASAPLDIGPILREQLFGRCLTVILTSPTLTTGAKSFDFIKTRLGLTETNTLKVCFQASMCSPFAHHFPRRSK